MKGNAFNLYETNQMLDDMYYDWLRLPEAKKWRAVSTRDKRFQFDSQLSVHRAVPTKFKEGTSLNELVQYLGLHTRVGRVKKPVRIVVESGDADMITIDKELDFSYATVLDALIQVCDACRGHYVVKGGKLMIIPNRLEKRQYAITGTARRAFREGDALWRVNLAHQPRKKTASKTITSTCVMDVLRQCGIHFPVSGGVEYDETRHTVKIDTSQQGFRDLECMLHYLHHAN